MPVAGPIIAAIVTAGATVYGAVSSAQNRTPKPQDLPAAPSPVDAAAKAKEEADRQRRIRALSGGNTILTSDTLGSSAATTNTAPKTLLGG